MKRQVKPSEIDRIKSDRPMSYHAYASITSILGMSKPLIPKLKRTFPTMRDRELFDLVCHRIDALLANDELTAEQREEHDRLAAAIGNKLDRLMLLGDASQEAPMIGLAVHEGVGKTESVGAVDWLDLHDGVVEIQNANGEPNAYISSPTIRGDLATLTTGDGTNAAKTWLGPPATVAPLSPYTTTACPNDYLFIGDFTQAVFAVRQYAEIHVSTEADEAFERNQVKIRITWRGDIGFLRPDWFFRLEGITT